MRTTRARRSSARRPRTSPARSRCRRRLWVDPLLYDLMLNTGRSSVESCVEQVVHCRAAGVPAPTASAAQLRSLVLESRDPRHAPGQPRPRAESETSRRRRMTARSPARHCRDEARKSRARRQSSPRSRRQVGRQPAAVDRVRHPALHRQQRSERVAILAPNPVDRSLYIVYLVFVPIPPSITSATPARHGSRRAVIWRAASRAVMRSLTSRSPPCPP